ncbi:MAG: glutamate--tRNA ligase [Planctomycetota bacterium]
MTVIQPPVRVRIAPSPTGDPHVGTAYVALFNRALARRHGGQFVLRIEDTDRTRYVEGAEEAILRSLRWLGLDWDEGPDVGGPYGPYRQSERTDIYRDHARMLLERGQAYRCFCTPERLATLRGRYDPENPAGGYDGHCRRLAESEAERRAAQGEPHVIRLKVEKSGETTVRDLLRGPVAFRNDHIDDQVLLKSDGFPTYHLANVVDDHLMKISHVMRAEEWLTSTPKHVLLYQAFGWQLPQFIHLPLLRNKDHSKISKRKNPVSLDYYREQGYLPEAMVNFLGLMGWALSDDQEVFTLEILTERFDPKDIRLGGPVFDLEKLQWLNGVYIRALTSEQLADRLLEGPLAGRPIGRAKLVCVAPLISERLKTLNDFDEKGGFFFAQDLDLDRSLFANVKKCDPPLIARMLRRVQELIEATETFDAEALEEPLRQLADSIDVKVGSLFMALRIAVTGSPATPPLLPSLAILGRDVTLARLEKAIALLEGGV